MSDTLSKRLDMVVRELNGWRAFAVRSRDWAAAGQLDSDRGRAIVNQARYVLGQLARVPRTSEAAAKAVEEWDYQGTLATDFTAIESAIEDCGDWVATRDGSLWTGFAIADTAPWAETVPQFSAGATSGLQTALNASITAIDIFLGNIQEV